MKLTRREFLKGASAAAGSLALPALAPMSLAQAGGAAQEALKAGVLTPAPLEQAIEKGAAQTGFWGFNGRVPGPVLRYRVGDTVRMALRNGLTVDTTVHWHGIRLPNAMDGVPHVTQKPVAPGEEFLYQFRVPDSGTFWYHPHQSSFEQVPRGLYGAFIVEEPRPIQTDRELVWVLSDVKLGADGQQVDDHGRILDLANEGRTGTHVLVNGRRAGADIRLEVRSGERVRLRLINAATARIFNLKAAGHAMRVVALDGQGVEPFVSEALELAPGMRTDLVLDCMNAPGASFPLTDEGHRGAGVVARIAYSAARPVRTKALSSPVRIAANRLIEPDLRRATDHYMVFQGGMRGGPVIGRIDGKPSPLLDIMEKRGLAWTMNYTAEHEHSLMHEPLLHLKQGEHVVLHMINETDFAHPMHLHGHFFRVLSSGGRRSRLQPWRDTALIAPRESLDIAFVADNPGEWMFHCHILDHAAGGMMGTVTVG